MAGAATTTATDGPEGETTNQRQARLRREKRQKRTAEEGEDRLAKIKALNGGVAPPDEVLGGPAKASKIVSVDDDPEEVDISKSGSFTPTPGTRTTNPQENPLAALLQQQQAQQTAQDDPFSRMMQQMMGGMGGDPNNPNATGDMGNMPAMLQAMMGGAQGQKEEAAPASSSAYVWRIVHAVFAFGLAFFICLTSTFNGSKLARSHNVYTEEAGYGLGPKLFIIFATTQLLLQSTRYFIEKGQLQGGGMFASIVNSGMIPQPYANYIRVAGRYITIARTIFVDVMTIVFVMGCMAWWKGMAVEA